jgi:hypothetical protein
MSLKGEESLREVGDPAITRRTVEEVTRNSGGD